MKWYDFWDLLQNEQDRWGGRQSKIDQGCWAP
jgi:hypothetical protein